MIQLVTSSYRLCAQNIVQTFCFYTFQDIVAGIYGLIVTTADSHAKQFIKNLRSENEEERRVSTDLLNSILSCSDLPGMYPIDESSSILSFGFWYTLQDDVLSYGTAEFAALMLVIKPYYRQLVCVLLRKSMYPSKWEDGKPVCWSLDDK